MRNRVITCATAISLGMALFATEALGQAVSPPAFLQWFEASYQTIENRIPDMWAAGYGQIWTPPPGRAQQGSLSVGYDVYDRFDLGQPGDPTLYGTEAGLRAVTRLTHRAGGDLYIDLVMNHNGFADLGTEGFLQSGGYPGFFLTRPDAIDGDFHSSFASGDLEGRLAGLIDIDQATNFLAIRSPVPGFANNLSAGTSPFNGRVANVASEENRRFYPDRSLDPIRLFDPSTGEGGIEIYPFNLGDPLSGDPVEENALGLMMRNVQWLVQSVGVDGFRIDAAKHMDRFTLDFFDRAVYRASFRRNLDGSRRDVFSFSEVFDGDRGFLESFIRKDIDAGDPSRVGGNRDALDFPQFFALRDNLTGNGLANDWRRVVGAGLDVNDDGLHNGSQGVMFVQSHDESSPQLSNVAHAYMLMHPGNVIVYNNAKEFGDNRDFPKDGRGDALGGQFGDTIQRLVEIRNTHGRGDYRERWLDKEVLAYERSGSALVILSNRLDGVYSQRTLDVDLPFGTYLIELTGNAKNDPNVPEILQVFDDCFACQTKVNVTVKPNAGGDQGYLVYGLATPQAPAGLELTNVAGVLRDNTTNNGTSRLTELNVITADSFQASLQTVEVNLLGSIRDADADGDDALIRLDGGRDINGNGQIDFTTPGSVAYGFEQFSTKASNLVDGGDGEFVQTISTVGLSEGVHFLEVRAFRHRDDGGPAVYSSFKKALYIDRLPPESSLETFEPIQAGVNENRRVTVRSDDQTADNVHVLLDLPAALSDEQILARIGAPSQSNKIDRDLFTYDLSGLSSGNHVLTLVSFEPSGNVGIRRVVGQFTSTIFGAGLGDIDLDGVYTPADVQLFEQVVYSRNTAFEAPADLDGDGRADTRDLFALGDRMDQIGASQSVRDEVRRAVLDRADIDGSGTTDSADIDAVFALRGSGDWTADLNSDSAVDDADVLVLVESVFQTRPGDANLDGLVSRTDLRSLVGGYGMAASWASGGFTGNSAVGLADLATLAGNINRTSGLSPPIQGVPEPNGLVLMLLAALCGYGIVSRRPGRLRPTACVHERDHPAGTQLL